MIYVTFLTQWTDVTFKAQMIVRLVATNAVLDQIFAKYYVL